MLGTSTQTDREQRIQSQRPLLSPVDRRGERTNIFYIIEKYLTIRKIKRPLGKGPKKNVKVWSLTKVGGGQPKPNSYCKFLLHYNYLTIYTKL